MTCIRIPSSKVFEHQVRVEFLKQHGDFLLVAVDADPHLRYDRIQLRKSSTDQVDFETFIANEQREFTSTDPNKQNLQKCIEMADVVIHNDGTIDELYEQFENFPCTAMSGNPKKPVSNRKHYPGFSHPHAT